MKNNPYVGPRPYERVDRHNFYGRDREARELRALIVAEREVLFYAQSGAGKTSLLNAQVIPALEEKGFHVLPVARVGSELPPGIDPGAVDNVFVFSALLALAGEDVEPQALLGHTLRSFLQSSSPTEDELESRPPVLILDQLEELFTTHRDHWQDAEGFFRQVREALDALPDLGVVFAMREDHVAEIDPYALLFSRRLRARFRMERLGPKGALEAVTKPALNANCAFAPGVAEQLVDNLRRTKVQRLGHAGEAQESDLLGPFVEPVQLQVVCQRLWENLPDQKDNTIQWEEVKEYGNIDQALTDFYESALAQAARETGLSERRLRRWFSEQLITPLQTRGLALRGQEEAAGLPNAAVDILEQRHLIRAEVRAGARWYELVHDRLVDPILQSNQAWEAAQQTPLRMTAKRWQETQNQDLLYRDETLKEALAWAKAHPDQVEPYEQEFLEASLQTQQMHRRMRRLRRTVTAGLLIGLVIVASLAIVAFYGWQEAKEQNRIAAARLLTAQAEVERNDPRGSWTLAGLLAVESLQRLPNLEANITLHRLLGGLAQPVTRMEHEQGVNVMVLSPDGKRVVSGSEDGTARVWEVNTGREVARAEHAGPVNAVDLSADGRWVVSGGADGVARVWEATTGREVVHQEHMEGVSTVAFGSDSRLVVSGSHDGTVLVWEAATGREVARMEHKGLSALAFSSDGQWVVSGSEDGTVRVWEAASGREVTRIAHEDRVRDVAFSPNGRWVASGSDDRTVRVWEAATGEELATLEHNGRVYAVTFSSDAQWIISGSDDFKARVWEIATGQQVAVMRGHGGLVFEAVLSSDGRWVVTGSIDRTARVWDVHTGEEVARMEHEGPVTSVAFSRDDQWVVSASRDATVGVWNVSAMLNEKRVTGREAARMAHEGRMNAITLHPDRQWAVSGGADGAMWIWDVGTVPDTGLAIGREMGRMESGVRVVAYSPDGSWLVSGSEDGTVQVWDVETGLEASKVKHGWQANAVAFSPDGQRAASGGGDGVVLVWEITTGHEIARMNHGWEVNSLAFTLDGQQVVSVSRNGTALFWDVATGREARRVAYPFPLTAVALSADGQRVVSGRHDGTVQVWEAATGREMARMKHELQVVAVAFSADGRWVMTSSYDGTARVWEAVSGREVSRIEHAGWADNLAFSHDGRWVVTVSYDTAWVWWWRPEDLTAQVCDNLSRNLTLEEWQRYIGGEPYHATCPDLPVPQETGR